jgi:hypothetical protein
MVKPVVVYGSEIWPMRETDMKRLNTWGRKILRGIYGPLVEHVIWRTRTNQELQELHKGLDIVADIEKKGLEWLGHLAGMNHGMVVMKIFESKLEGRRMGRPTLKLLEGVKRSTGAEV